MSSHSKSRRTFLKACAIAGAAHAVPLPAMTFAAPGSIIVIGAGAFGGWTALHLRRAGASVTLLDAWGPGNSRASSGGETRVIRAGYGPSRLYSGMAKESLVRWKQEEKRWNRKLFYRTGALWFAGSKDEYERNSLAVLKALGIAAEQLTVAEAQKRWPQVNYAGVNWVLHEPEAGYLTARSACAAVLEAFIAEGGTYRQAWVTPGNFAAGKLASVRLHRGQELKADAYVFACGPWLSEVLPGIPDLITPTRQEVFFFGTPAGDVRFTDESLPVWIDNGEKLFYGIPGNQFRGFKLADDSRGPRFDPTNGDRHISDEALGEARDYVAMRFPGLKGAPLVESRVCQYENSPDQDFILDRHPQASNVWVLGGGSGHGFKHGPAIGRMAADAVLENSPPPKEFALARFATKS